MQCCGSAFHISSCPALPLSKTALGDTSAQRSTSRDQSPTLDGLYLVSDGEVPPSTSKYTGAGHGTWRHLVGSRKPNRPSLQSQLRPTILCIPSLYNERTASSFFAQAYSSRLAFYGRHYYRFEKCTNAVWKVYIRYEDLT